MKKLSSQIQCQAIQAQTNWKFKGFEVFYLVTIVFIASRANVKVIINVVRSHGQYVQD
jgi:hypothetical protein